MTFSKKKTAVIATAISSAFLLSGSQAISSLSMTEALDSVKQVAPTEEDTTELVEAETTPMWVGENFNSTESRVLEFLQERGITDRAALATILGNIKQESMFETTICEGGVKTGYHRCYSGGFGLIQWTTSGRYRGLGNFSAKYGLDPNSLDAQLRWMVNEIEWKKVDHIWKREGGSIDTYMNAAYRWLGWGVHGNRTLYAHTYYSALSMV